MVCKHFLTFCKLPYTPLILEKEMATPASVLAWRIPWTEEPARLHGVTRVGHDLATKPLPSPLIQKGNPSIFPRQTWMDLEMSWEESSSCGHRSFILPAVAHLCSHQISSSRTWAAVSAHCFSSAWLYYLLVMTILYLLSHETHF